METIELCAGEHVQKASIRLSVAAASHGAAKMEFNDVTVIAKAGDTPDQIVNRWQAQQDAAHQAYINSDAGKAAAAAREKEVQRLQNKHDDLMVDLQSLDFASDVAVLDWLCAMQEPSDHIRVATRNADIVRIFSDHGFEAGVNCGDNYQKDDRDNAFRYLVGQCLSGLKSVAIHGIIHKFAADWKERFVARCGN